jgi:hypothetical protein
MIKEAFNRNSRTIYIVFCFVDMKENYPFAGVGNLFNFCRGLTSIRIKNDILVIFDNDVAGVRQYNKANKTNKHLVHC